MKKKENQKGKNGRSSDLKNRGKQGAAQKDYPNRLEEREKR